MSSELPQPHDLESVIEQRNLLLQGLDRAVIQKAWFTLSHLILDNGARVADIGCDDGAMTYAMAALAPKLRFIGVDKSKRQINKAREKYQLHNLEFKIGDTGTDIFEPESLDAIVNSYVLHEVYSASRYNERFVADTLRRQFRFLKKGGIMFVRDFVRPPPEQLVLLEMPDKPSRGEDPAHLSDPDLLVWYAQHARPRHDAGTGGFFLEELPARFPKTRLFRLPYKWAYEFIMRKDDRTHWDTALPVEYTFFTLREFRRELQSMGARTSYTAPYWDDELIEEKFEGKFRLYDDQGAPLSTPPTCFVIVATKMAERKSLHIHERRPASAKETNLQIHTVRDEKTGRLIDVVARPEPLSEILPYRLDEHGQLKIFLQDGVARSIANAVARNGGNLDDRRWSGHMIEPLSVDQTLVFEMDRGSVKETALFARDYLGLLPQSGALLEKGPDFYPAPDFIDERVFTFFLKVEEARGHITPRQQFAGEEHFQARPVIREMDAQQVLNAITVGMIPNARLELQILALFKQLKIPPENWTGRQLILQSAKINVSKKLRMLLDIYGSSMKRFRQIKGSAGQLRPIHSVFVEEGQTRGTTTGLSAQEVDFVVHNDRSSNVAVILPLADSLKGDVVAGFLLEHLPVPERMEGSGLSFQTIRLDLPANIRDTRDAKKFIADHFGILPELVLKLGESYFSHIGLTPQRIHPFAVTLPATFMKAPGRHFLPFYQLKLLRKSLSRDTHFMVLIARAYRMFNDKLRLDARLEASNILKQRFAAQQQELILPLEYRQAPILINTEEKAQSKEPAPEREPKSPAAPEQKSDRTTNETAKPESAPTQILRPANTSKPQSDAKAADTADLDASEDHPEAEEQDFESEFEEFLKDQNDDTLPKLRHEKW